MSLVHNERTKLTATYLNGLAIALFAVGSLSSLFTGLNSATGRSALMGVLVGLCIPVSVALHWGARLVLRGLKE